MIPLLALLLAGSGPPAPHADEARFKTCVSLTDTNPPAAIVEATGWWKANGGVLAGQCLGLAYSAAGAWTSATVAFSDAAELAVEQKDGRAAMLWTSAGNAALAGGDAARARVALDKALALPSMTDPMRGEAYLDRARADVAANELPAARTDLDAALKLVAGDPMAWLLSATLARRMGDTARASADIDQAQSRAPGEPAILLEAGNIAAASGDMPAARTRWSRARAAGPGTDAGHAAEKALMDSGGLPPEKPEVQGR